MIRTSFFYLLVLMSFEMVAQQQKPYYPSFDLQGHRGARGMFPENTIPAFLAALQEGVTTVELDVVITADKQVLVSHEPYLSPEICLGLNGEEFGNEKQYNLYKMMYAEIAACDCGSKKHERFPEQVKMKTIKPLLRDVIVQVEDFIKNKTKYEVDYNIEIKSVKGEEGISQPDVKIFSDLVIQLIDEYLPLDRVVIQSFDFRVLQYIKKNYPTVRLALLIENKLSWEENIKQLGFTPEIYSPYYQLLTEERIKAIKQARMRVIPWTVNDASEMLKLKTWGVDGLITDYPNRAKQLGLGWMKN